LRAPCGRDVGGRREGGEGKGGAAEGEGRGVGEAQYSPAAGGGTPLSEGGGASRWGEAILERAWLESRTSQVWGMLPVFAGD
jgi:hypothetical protein